MGVERRKFIRHPLSYPLKTRVHQSSAGLKEVVGESHNIGAGGLLFFSENPFDPGSEVNIELCGTIQTIQKTLHAPPLWSTGFGLHPVQDGQTGLDNDMICFLKLTATTLSPACQQDVAAGTEEKETQIQRRRSEPCFA